MNELLRFRQQDGGLKRKHVIMGVLALLGVITAVVGITLTAYFLHKSAKDVKIYHEHFQDKKGNKIDEDIESDADDNVVVYHVTENGEDLWLLHDFNRYITVYKFGGGKPEERACFVSPLDKERLGDTNADVRKALTGEKPGAKAEISYDADYMSSLNKPIPDTTFLGHKIGKLCKGLPMFWTQSAYVEPASKDEKKRDKRAVSPVAKMCRPICFVIPVRRRFRVYPRTICRMSCK